jgi:hypothetical protein
MNEAKVRPTEAGWLIDEIRMGDFDDPWGTAMEWLFAVCHVLWHHTAEEIPASWEYHHSPVPPTWCVPSVERDDSYAESVIMDHWPTLSVENPDRGPAEALLYVGRVLDRYAQWCRLAGRDY